MIGREEIDKLLQEVRDPGSLDRGELSELSGQLLASYLFLFRRGSVNPDFERGHLCDPEDWFTVTLQMKNTPTGYQSNEGRFIVRRDSSSWRLRDRFSRESKTFPTLKEARRYIEGLYRRELHTSMVKDVIKCIRVKWYDGSAVRHVWKQADKIMRKMSLAPDPVLLNKTAEHLFEFTRQQYQYKA